MFFNATKSKPSPPLARPIKEQEERESQRLWEKTAKAVKERNHELATDEKTKIEDRQREEAAARAHDNVEWLPRLFRAVRSGPGEPEEGEESLEWIINAHMLVSSPQNIFCQTTNTPQRYHSISREADGTDPRHIPNCSWPDIWRRDIHSATGYLAKGDQKVDKPCG